MDQESTTYWQNLETVTRSALDGAQPPKTQAPGLTILAHPDARRIGERSVLTALVSGREVPLSRLQPAFAAPGDSRRRPLADPHLSRRPLRLIPASEGAVRLLAAGTKTRITADGTAVEAGRDFSPVELERGVVLLLQESVALLLHVLDPTPPQELPHFGAIGESAGIVAVRQQIVQVADLEVPALLRGDTGTGKELVAAAIHQASARRSRPFVAVNMGALPPTLAAAELFGAAKGAFTGADRRRTGYFARADGGTLFLDEIGETPTEVQGLLLRVLETGIVQPVGAEKSHRVDVRILAATDAHLEAEIEAGRFRAPLLHRLSGYEIRLPALRQRRDDVGRLLLHFLREELEALGETWRLDPPGTAAPWLSATVVARLAAFDWPGNVRQLKNVARQLVIANRGAAMLEIPPELEALLESPAAPADRAPSSMPAANPSPASARSAMPAPLAEAENRPVLRTLLSADLADSPGLGAGLGVRRAAEVMGRYDHGLRGLLPKYGGYEVDKSEGFLLLFELPADAVGYALDYHEMLAALSHELEIELAGRVGIHLGEVFFRRNTPEEVARGARAIEIEGPAGALAARLAALAAGGQTLLTAGAFDLARQSARGDHALADLELRWLRHGEFRLPATADPLEVFEVGIAGTAPFVAPAGPEKGGSAAEEAPPAGEESVSKPAARRKAYRSPGEVGEDELLEALKAHQFRLQPAAAALGVSRTSLYALIEKSSRVRKARDLSREEIERCRERFAGDLDAMAAELEVSRKGLSRRMTALGVSA